MKNFGCVCAVAVSAVLMGTPAAYAQGTGTGPVARACVTDIQQYCAGLEHGQGEIRDCLEANKDKVSAQCREALETTGFGRKRRQNQ